ASSTTPDANINRKSSHQRSHRASGRGPSTPSPREGSRSAAVAAPVDRLRSQSHAPRSNQVSGATKIARKPVSSSSASHWYDKNSRQTTDSDRYATQSRDMTSGGARPIRRQRAKT